MKRVIVILMLAAVLSGPAALAYAASYNYNGTFYHLVYAQPTFNITGTTSCAGYQKQLSGTKPTGIQYALVTKAADPVLDIVHTWKTIYGNVGYSFSFAALKRTGVRLRFYNVYYEGSWPGDNRVNTAGTFSGSFTVQ